jgi:hypothetical protein
MLMYLVPVYVSIACLCIYCMFMYLLYVYVFIVCLYIYCMFMYLVYVYVPTVFMYLLYVYVSIVCLCIYCMFIYCMFKYLHRASWHSSATLTEVFPYFFLSCKANARVKPAKMGHGPHSS